MKTKVHSFRTVTVLLACLSWLLPAAPSWATTPPAPTVNPAKPVVYDLKLDGQGTLRGQLLDVTGQALTDQSILLNSAGVIVAQTKTDEAGRFAFGDLRGGVYLIGIADAAVMCRVWTTATAPPAAREQLLVVATSEDVVRGQQPFSAVLTNPLVIGVAVAAAIAIPIAIHDSNSSQPPGS